MKKRSVISVAFLLILIVPVFAQNPSDFEFRRNLDGDAITIWGYIGNATKVAIPAEIEGLPVHYIGDEAFRGNTNIIEVIIPETVEWISRDAFRDCTRLSSIILPKTLLPKTYEVDYIHTGAFQGCTNLTSIILPNGIKKISSNMFEGCSRLASIDIPNSVVHIEEAAFRSTGLVSIVIPGSVRWIRSNAFADCTNLIVVVLEEGTHININAMAFNGCSKLDTRSQNDLRKAGYNGFN